MNAKMNQPRQVLTMFGIIRNDLSLIEPDDMGDKQMRIVSMSCRSTSQHVGAPCWHF